MAVQPGLCETWSETPKTGFLTTRLKFCGPRNLVEVKSMQRPGNEAIRTQIQPSKPKQEITKITNSQNTKRTYGQTSEQLFLKRWPLSNPNRTKVNMNTHKVKRHLESLFELKIKYIANNLCSNFSNMLFEILDLSCSICRNY